MQTNTSIQKLGYPLKHPGVEKLRLILGFAALITIGLIIYSLIPRTLTLSISGSTCTSRLQLLPRLISEKNDSYNLDFRNVIKISGYPILAFKTCYTLQQMQNTGDKTPLTPLLGPIPLMSNGVYIKYPSLPSVSPKSNLLKPISAISAMEFELSDDDGLFSYYLRQDDWNKIECHKQAKILTCPISELNLMQGLTYDLVLTRALYNNHSVDIDKYSVTTANQILLTQQFAPDNIVYDAPTELVISADRKLADSGIISLLNNDTGDVIPVEAKLNSNSLALLLSTPLVRSHTYTLTIKDALADDGGTLNEDYVLRFYVATGPKVTGVAFSKTGLSLRPWLKITFDQPINELQELSSNVSIKTLGQNFAVFTEVDGANLWVQPKANLPSCNWFSIVINDKLQNIYGIDGGSSFESSARTKCYDQFSIGSSVQGKAITAYSVGNGNKKVLFIGAIHGSEPGSSWLLQSWLSDLDANIDKIPADIQVIVIPTINPDGFASGNRFNSRGVDLNRNFPTSNWQSSTYSSANTLLLNGGGSAPLSEPESDSIATYIRNNRPIFAMSYHSQGSYVIANDAGNSANLASIYSNLTGYQYFDGSNYADAFDYAVTGSFEDWMLEEIGTATLLVELPSHYSNEYSANSDAMWRMISSL